MDIRAHVPDTICDHLSSLGARFDAEIYHYDEYFEVRDIVLRVRLSAQQCFFTLICNAREWTEEIMHPEIICALLRDSAAKKVASIDKHRKTYRLDDFLIHVDRIHGLGFFLEVESPRARDFMINVLKISADNIITQGYMELVNTYGKDYSELH